MYTSIEFILEATVNMGGVFPFVEYEVCVLMY